MDINQTTPLLLANIVRYLAFNRIKVGKIYVLILTLAIGFAGTILFFELWASMAKADFNNNDSAYFKGDFEPGLVVFGGNALVSLSNPSNTTTQPSRIISVVLTAYSSTPWETDGNPYITASGNWVRDGIVANNMLAFGTKVRIPEVFGNKVFIVEDRMNSRKGYYQIDIWFPSYWEALNFGTKRTYIEIWEG